MLKGSGRASDILCYGFEHSFEVEREVDGYVHLQISSQFNIFLVNSIINRWFYNKLDYNHISDQFFTFFLMKFYLTTDSHFIVTPTISMRPFLGSSFCWNCAHVFGETERAQRYEDGDIFWNRTMGTHEYGQRNNDSLKKMPSHAMTGAEDVSTSEIPQRLK